jgi:aspartate/tyrosine/aromatic aminotransferase
VTTVLNDEQLTARWIGEVAQMRDRINSMRSLLVERLAAAGVERDFSFIKKQLGMFSFTGLTPEQTDTLRENDSIYIVRSGRINIAGVTEANVGRLTEAIARVL